jgi:hypothetical protein
MNGPCANAARTVAAVEIFDPGYHNFNNTEEDFKLQSRLMAGYLVEHLHGPNAIDAIMAPSEPSSASLRRPPRAWQGA